MEHTSVSVDGFQTDPPSSTLVLTARHTTLRLVDSHGYISFNVVEKEGREVLEVDMNEANANLVNGLEFDIDEMEQVVSDATVHLYRSDGDWHFEGIYENLPITSDFLAVDPETNTGYVIHRPISKLHAEHDEAFGFPVEDELLEFSRTSEEYVVENIENNWGRPVQSEKVHEWFKNGTLTALGKIW